MVNFFVIVEAISDKQARDNYKVDCANDSKGKADVLCSVHVFEYVVFGYVVNNKLKESWGDWLYAILA